MGGRELEKRTWLHFGITRPKKRIFFFFSREEDGKMSCWPSLHSDRSSVWEAVPILGSKQHKVLNLSLVCLSMLGDSLSERKRPGALGQWYGLWRHLKREWLAEVLLVYLVSADRVSQWLWGAPWTLPSALPWPWPPYPAPGSPAISSGSQKTSSTFQGGKF